MNRFTRVLFPILLCSLIIAVPSLGARWIEDGIPVCDAANSQDNMDTISDGEGGMFLAWRDARSGQRIFAQHIDNRGNELWTAQGIEISTGVNSQDNPALTLDGAGGIYVVYQEFGEEDWDIYAQRIDRDGVIQVEYISTASAQRHFQRTGRWCCLDKDRSENHLFY